MRSALQLAVLFLFWFSFKLLHVPDAFFSLNNCRVKKEIPVYCNTRRQIIKYFFFQYNSKHFYCNFFLLLVFVYNWIKHLCVEIRFVFLLLCLNQHLLFIFNKAIILQMPFSLRQNLHCKLYILSENEIYTPDAFEINT